MEKIFNLRLMEMTSGVDAIFFDWAIQYAKY